MRRTIDNTRGTHRTKDLGDRVDGEFLPWMLSIDTANLSIDETSTESTERADQFANVTAGLM